MNIYSQKISSPQESWNEFQQRSEPKKTHPQNRQKNLQLHKVPLLGNLFIDSAQVSRLIRGHEFISLVNRPIFGDKTIPARDYFRTATVTKQWALYTQHLFSVHTFMRTSGSAYGIFHNARFASS